MRLKRFVDIHKSSIGSNQRIVFSFIIDMLSTIKLCICLNQHRALFVYGSCVIWHRSQQKSQDTNCLFYQTISLFCPLMLKTNSPNSSVCMSVGHTRPLSSSQILFNIVSNHPVYTANLLAACTTPPTWSTHNDYLSLIFSVRLASY